MARIALVRLSLLLFVLLSFEINETCPDLYRNEEASKTYNVHGSESEQTLLDEEHDEIYRSNACGAAVKCDSHGMKISLPKSLLSGLDREDLRLLDSNCKATENSTHFFLKTSLIGCGTTSRHTENSVIYSNVVQQYLPQTAIITRAPEVEISFSCHYSNYGTVSAGSETSRNGTYRSDRSYWRLYSPTCPK